MSHVRKYPNNFYLFCVFQFKLTLKVFYTVPKTHSHFGCMETYAVILSLHIKSFGPRVEHAEQVSLAQLKRCIRLMQRSKDHD